MKIGQTFTKGLWIGATMTVPGVSGGTMAILAGIYEKLIHSVCMLRKSPKEQLPFLIEFVLGAVTGIVLFARFITMLLQNELLGVPMQFFFCGVVAGGVPFLVQKSGAKGLSPKNMLLVLGGIGVIFALGQIPQGIWGVQSGFPNIVLQMAGGVIAAIALVLPGISVTHMLYFLGLYEMVMESISSFHFFKILPLAVGLFLGIFLSAALLEKWMEQHPGEMYLIILGFVGGSVWELLPRGNIEHMFLCCAMAAVGFLGMRIITGLEKRDGEE